MEKTINELSEKTNEEFLEATRKWLVKLEILPEEFKEREEIIKFLKNNNEKN